MNHERWMEQTEEHLKVVYSYINHLKDESIEFTYSKRKLRKALQVVFDLAVKHRRLIKYEHFKRIEDKYLETERPEAPFSE